jgi:hypothetical protein
MWAFFSIALGRCQRQTGPGKVPGCPAKTLAYRLAASGVLTFAVGPARPASETMLDCPRNRPFHNRCTRFRVLCTGHLIRAIRTICNRTPSPMTIGKKADEAPAAGPSPSVASKHREHKQAEERTAIGANVVYEAIRARAKESCGALLRRWRGRVSRRGFPWVSP